MLHIFSIYLGARRNAVDWAISMYNRPWFAANHCNVTFHEFITKLWCVQLTAESHLLIIGLHLS